MPEGVFGNVTFEEIYIDLTPLESVHLGAFLPLKDQLRILDIGGSALVEFPWAIVSAEFTRLTELWLTGSRVTTLPPLRSDILETLFIIDNEITELQTGWSLPNLRFLYLGE